MPKKYHAPKPEKPYKATGNRLYVENPKVKEDAEQYYDPESSDPQEVEAYHSHIAMLQNNLPDRMTLKQVLDLCGQLPAYYDNKHPDQTEDIIIEADYSDPDGDNLCLYIYTELPDETDEDFNKRLKQYELELAEWTTKEALYQEEQKAKKVLELEEKVKKLKKESK